MSGKSSKSDKRNDSSQQLHASSSSLQRGPIAGDSMGSYKSNENLRKPAESSRPPSDVKSTRQSESRQSGKSQKSVRSQQPSRNDPPRDNDEIDNIDERNAFDSDNNEETESNPLRNGRSTNLSSRELVNRTRNGYYNTKYFTDVKEYFNEKNFDEEDLKKNKKYLQDLLHDFRKLLERSLKNPEQGLHDVMFCERGKAGGVPAHKQLLIARSATFEALFNSEEDKLGFEKTERNGVIEVFLPSDPEISLEEMEIVLHYMYWGNLDEQNMSENELTKLFRIASFLDLKELRRRLGGKLNEHLKNVKDDTKAEKSINFLLLAVECGCKYLKSKSIDYIVDNKSTIFQTDAWKGFITKKEGQALIKEIYQRSVVGKK